jgi:uncharacterized protein YukJ
VFIIFTRIGEVLSEVDMMPKTGIWQEGALIIQKSDGTVVGFLNMFKSQVDSTDNNGTPELRLYI